MESKKYTEYQKGRSVKTSDGERKIRERIGDAIAFTSTRIFLSLEKSNSPFFNTLAFIELTDEFVKDHPLVPLKESPMAWLKDGVEYWSFFYTNKGSIPCKYIGDGCAFERARKSLGLAWPTKEECEAWIKEQEEKNK